jgi:hypothetical protein
MIVALETAAGQGWHIPLAGIVVIVVVVGIVMIAMVFRPPLSAGRRSTEIVIGRYFRAVVRDHAGPGTKASKKTNP